jgi:hypothetical protein
MTSDITPWIDDIASWVADHDNATRFEKVMGYTGCRELWLQAELAMWLEKHQRVAANGNWDTNLLIAGYGRCDVAVRNTGGGFDLALEVKVLGGDYQAKVLTGASGTLKSCAAALSQRGWKVEPQDLLDIGGFSLLKDYGRLSALPDVGEKILLLVVDNRRSPETELGKALAQIQFPAKLARTQDIVAGLNARLWQL